jgi:YggT family protein
MSLRYLITKLIYGFFILVELFLVLRFVLKLFGASTGNAFVVWVYETSGVLLDPFRGVFPTPVFQSTYVLELSTIFAMIIYGIATMLLIALVEFLTRPAVVASKKK